MTALYCKSAGQARACGECKFSPVNQTGQPKGRTIAPPIKKDGKCPHFIGVIRARDEAGR